MLSTNKKQIKLQEKNGKIIECDIKLLHFSKVLKDLDPNDVIPFPQYDENVLRKIIEFYEIFQFEEKEFQTIEFKKKITSDKLKDNLTQKCLDFLRDWIIDETKVDIEQMKEIVDACFRYDFIELKECLLKAIGTDFWCGTSDQQQKEFKQRHNQPDEISRSEKLKIMKENKDTFDDLNKKLLEEFKQDQAQENIETDQQLQQFQQNDQEDI